MKAARKERAFLLEIPKDERAKKIGNLNTRTTRQSKMTTRNKPITEGTETTEKPKKPKGKRTKEQPKFEINELIETKLVKNKPYILVSWKGYGPDNNTWEPREKLMVDVPEMVLNFEKK